MIQSAGGLAKTLMKTLFICCCLIHHQRQGEGLSNNRSGRAKQSRAERATSIGVFQKCMISVSGLIRLYFKWICIN